MKKLFLIVITASTLLQISFSTAQTPKEIVYPYPVSYLSFTLESNEAKMAYMDVMPDVPNGQTVLLLHGKNFTGYYWKNVIVSLSDKGYRVIAKLLPCLEAGV